MHCGGGIGISRKSVMIIIKRDMWPAYMRTVDELDIAGKPCYAKVTKLMPKLRNMKRYVVHHQIFVIVCRWAYVCERPT